MKICSKCKETKEFEFFDKQRDKKDGYRVNCKACRKQQQNSQEAKAKRKEYAARNKEKIAAYYKEKYYKNQEQILEQSRLNRLANKDHVNELGRENYRKNKEQHLSKSQKWKKSEKGKQKLAEYALKNKERRKAYMKEYNKSERGKKKYHDYYHNVLKKSPQYKISSRVRTQLYERLKKERNIKRNISFEETIGCEIPFLEAHLKSTMTEGMTWQMFLDAELVIDHIRPCCSFDLTNNEELKKCFNFLNLRLFPALDNSIKAAQDKKLKLLIEPNPL